MKYTIFQTPIAKKETEDAVYYYESVSKGLGLAFLSEVEKKYDSISRNPFAYSYIDGRNLIRDVKLKRFPFVIIYKVEAERVVILSVHNTNKYPRY